MSKRNSIIAAVIVAIMAILGITGILAYLTDAEHANNTFTVGEVKIDLIEPTWPGNESDKIKELTPNQAVSKDPQIVNTGTNDAIVFAKLWIPKRKVILANVNDGKKADTTASLQEIVTLLKGGSMLNGVLSDAMEIELTVGEPGTAVNMDENWILLASQANVNAKGEAIDDISNVTEAYDVFTFGYKKKLSAQAKNTTTADGVNSSETKASGDIVTAPLFDYIRLKYIIEEEVKPNEKLNLKVEAYAIQADYIMSDDGSTDISTAETEFDAETLQTILTRFVNQNGTATVNNAHKNNKYDIPQGTTAASQNNP